MASDSEIERGLGLLTAPPAGASSTNVAPDKEIERGLGLLPPPDAATPTYSAAGTYTPRSEMTPGGGRTVTVGQGPPPTLWPEDNSLPSRIANAPGNAAEAVLHGLWNAPGAIWQGVKEGYNTPNLLIAAPTQDRLDANSTPLGALSHLGNAVTGIVGGGMSGLTHAGLNTVANVADTIVPANAGGSFGRDLAGIGEYELTRRAGGDTATLAGTPRVAAVDTNNLLSPEFKAKPTSEGFKPSVSVGPNEPNTLLDKLKLDKESIPNDDPNSPQTSKFVERLHGALATHIGHGLGAGIGGAAGGTLGYLFGGPVGAQIAGITSSLAGPYIADALREATAAYGPKVASAIAKRLGVPLPSPATVATAGALRDQEVTGTQTQ